MPIRYYHVEPLRADEYISKPDHWVWYFRPGQKDPPPRCTDKKDRPADAESAVVASPNEAFAAGVLMGMAKSIKDPIPPPPPPSRNPKDYLSQPAFKDFFTSINRDTNA